MLKKTVEISVLNDAYNQLLTERQKDIVDLYYNQDLSLGEIAQEFNISRQAVYDMLKRTEKSLYQYEKKLNIVKLTQAKRERVSQIIDKLMDLENELISISSSKELLDQVLSIKDELYKLLGN